MAIPTHLRLEFVTPDWSLVHEDVDEVGLPGAGGHFGVLPGHAPLLAALGEGPLWFRKGNVTHWAFVARGFAEVVGDRVSVLAPVAERAEDIDRERAEASKRRAEERLTGAKIDINFERARISLLRAVSRLHVVEQARRRSS